MVCRGPNLEFDFASSNAKDFKQALVQKMCIEHGQLIVWPADEKNSVYEEVNLPLKCH